MNGTLVAAIAAVPPTLAAVLTFVAARSAMRRDSEKRTVTLTHAIESVQGAVERVDRTVERIDAGVGDLRERVARLEGARDARTSADA